MSGYCIFGLILGVALVYFFAYALCCVAARADEYQVRSLEELERKSSPKITGEL